MRKLFVVILMAVPCAALVVGGPMILGHLFFAAGKTDIAATLLGDTGWRGYTLAARNDFLGAAEAFGPAPANAYNRGNALVSAGLYKQALDAYDAALDADPEDEDARFNKAVVEKILDTQATPDGTTAGNANASARQERHHGGVGNQNGDTNSVGIGFVGNKEGSTNSGAQGGSKVSKIGRGQSADSGLDGQKASGSAGQASGKGRTGGDLVDITMQLAFNQRRVGKNYTARSIRPDVEWLQTVSDDPGTFLKLQIRAEQKRRKARDAAAQGDD